MGEKQRLQDGALRSIRRAITLLRALNRRPESTLHDLHRDTGLPKPSIVRLLRTLEGKGLAVQAANYGAYQLLGSVKSLSSGFHHEPLIIEAAEDIMVDFTRAEGWPLMLAFFDVDAMVVRVCTIPHTSLWVEESALNQRLSVAGHALGRVHLAFSAPNEQKFLREIVRHSANPDDAPAHDDAAVAAMIDQVRRQGFAIADPAIEQRSSTIAVPICVEGRVVACLGMTWIIAAMTERKAVQLHVPRLLDLAQAIARRVVDHSRQGRARTHEKEMAVG
jgi:IclR family mhp operon transcriptional activator